MSVQRVAQRLVLGLACLLLPQAAMAETLPTSGTFKGIYHKDRAGRAYFLFFEVPQKLQPLLDAHDGQYIQVEVLKAARPSEGMRRGGTIEQLGKITVLPQPTVKIHIELHPPVCGAANTVDVFTVVENTGAKPLKLAWGPTISGPNIGAYLCGYPGGTVTLAPGQKAPSVELGFTLGPGSGEIGRCVDTPMGPAMAWINIDVDKAGRIAQLSKVASRFKVMGRIVRREQEYLYFQANLASPDGAPRAVYTTARSTHNVISNLEKSGPWLPCRIQAFDARGSEIAVSTGVCVEEGDPVQRTITAKGLDFEFRLRHQDLFADRPIRKVVLHILTDRGLERFEIPVKEDPAVAALLPAFGPAVDGHKIRIRMAKPQFAPGEVARWYLQGVDEEGRQDMFWVDKGQLPKAVRILVDGKALTDDRNHGISEEIVHPFPFQVIMSAVPPANWKPGQHTVEVILDGQTGTYTNLDGVKWSKFGKLMQSNKCTFEIR